MGRNFAMKSVLFLVPLLGAASGCGAPATAKPVKTQSNVKAAKVKTAKVKAAASLSKPMKITKTDAQWRQELSPESYQVLRQHGTERAFSGALWNNHEKGVYECAGCGQELFASDTKFESGTGWPSFYQPVVAGAVEEKVDNSYGMRRVEIVCSRCGGHLGHVFDDGPKPTGLRYCMNSAALQFDKK